MISWIVNIVGLLAAWYYTDLDATSVMQNAICPVLVALFLMSLLIKFVFFLGPQSGRGGHGGYSGGGGGSSGGDGGCGGDGGGC